VGRPRPIFRPRDSRSVVELARGEFSVRWRSRGGIWPEGGRSSIRRSSRCCVALLSPPGSIFTFADQERSSNLRRASSTPLENAYCSPSRIVTASLLRGVERMSPRCCTAGTVKLLVVWHRRNVLKMIETDPQRAIGLLNRASGRELVALLKRMSERGESPAHLRLSVDAIATSAPGTSTSKIVRSFRPESQRRRHE